ncbi:MAG: hypothetical protein AB8G77_27875 [Rhodothermales bacterium]
MNISALQTLERGVLQQAQDVKQTSVNRQSRLDPNDKPRIDTPEEAAKTFEKVLVEQFVNVMTEQLFKSNLAGEDGPGWMKAYGDTQRRVMTEVLTDHLVDNGTFNISSLVLEQWQRK